MILFIPVDIPPIPKFDILESEAKEFAFWTYQSLTKPSYDIPYSTSEILVTDERFTKWITHFPYEAVINLKVINNVSKVEPHVDFTKPNDNLRLYHNNLINEPCGYRVIIKGKKQGVLYVINDKGEKVYPEIPEDTDTFLINHTYGIHGAEFEEGRSLLFCHFQIDQKAHRALLVRSLEKYKEYVIYD